MMLSIRVASSREGSVRFIARRTFSRSDFQTSVRITVETAAPNVPAGYLTIILTPCAGILSIV